MKRLLLAVCCVVGTAAATSTQVAPAADVDNVVAFARLYGVVRYFYPGDAAAAVDWNGFAVHGVSRVRSAGDAEALEAALEALFLPLGPGIEIGPALSPPPSIGAPDSSLVAWRYLGVPVAPTGRPGPYRAERTNRPTAMPPAGWAADPEPIGATPLAGDHVDVSLARGLRARVSLALSSADAARRPDPAALDGLLAVVSRAQARREADADTNLAGVVVAWNVYRHFYPYWAEFAREPKVDWDAELAGHLRAAAGATTMAQQRDVLRQLVAGVHDGHGRVSDPSGGQRHGVLPIQARLIEERITVTASATSSVPVGSVVTAVDGQPAVRWLEGHMRRASGTPQWKAEQSLRRIGCEAGTTTTLTLDDSGRGRSAALVCGAAPAARPAEPRPEAIAELSPGLWYVDLTRASFDQITSSLGRLAEARGIVFDVRGYPTDAGAAILPHLVDAPEQDRWMHIDRISGPFGRVSGTRDLGWNLQPKPPRIAGRRVFLTDGRAISYAESVMGYVADRRLGTIVGTPTAGANGNVASFEVPGGYAITFTGMRVTRHDGTSPHHLIGITPDVPLAPTIAGIRRGRDELLEKAVARIDQARPPAPARK